MCLRRLIVGGTRRNASRYASWRRRQAAGRRAEPIDHLDPIRLLYDSMRTRVEPVTRDRMMEIVLMFRDATAPKGRDRYSCPVPIWEFLCELGGAFGWQPAGTTYVVPPGLKREAPARRNYQPGGSRDSKRLQEQDAVAWARALEAAKMSPHTEAMIQARATARAGESGGELLPGVLDEFIEFAYGGAFEFTLSNEDASGAVTDSEQ